MDGVNTNNASGSGPVNPSVFENPVMDALQNKQDLSNYTPDQLEALAKNIGQLGGQPGNWQTILDSLQTMQEQNQSLDVSNFMVLVEVDNPQLPQPTSSDPQQVTTDFNNWLNGLTAGNINTMGQSTYSSAQYVAYVVNTLENGFQNLGDNSGTATPPGNDTASEEGTASTTGTVVTDADGTPISSVSTNTSNTADEDGSGTSSDGSPTTATLDDETGTTTTAVSDGSTTTTLDDGSTPVTTDDSAITTDGSDVAISTATTTTDSTTATTSTSSVDGTSATDATANANNASLVSGMIGQASDALDQVKALLAKVPPSDPNYMQMKDMIGALESALTQAEATFALAIQGNQSQITSKSQAQMEKQLDEVKKQQEQYEAQKKAAEKAHTMGLLMKILGPILAVVAAVLAIVTGGTAMALVLAATVAMVADMVVQQTTGKGLLSRIMDGVNDLIMMLPLPDSVKQSIAMVTKIALIAGVVAASIAAGGNVALAIQVCMTLTMNSGIGQNCADIAKDAGASDSTAAIVNAVVTSAIAVAGLVVSIKSAGQTAEDITAAAQKVSTLDALLAKFPNVQKAVDTILTPFNFASDKLAAIKEALLKQIQGGKLEAAVDAINNAPSSVRTGATYGLIGIQGTVQAASAATQGAFTMRQADFTTQIANIEAEIQLMQSMIQQLKKLIQSLLSGIQPQIDFKTQIDNLKSKVFSGLLQAQGSFPV